jgi:hypothetical protein
MADFAGTKEAEEIGEMYKNFPSSTEIGHMCYTLGIERDLFRGLEEQDAWAYYHELKAMIDQKQRKTA